MRGDKIRRLCLLQSNLFSGNMGCNAITYSTLRLLDNIADIIQLDFEFIVEEKNALPAATEPLDLCISHPYSISRPFTLSNLEKLRLLKNRDFKTVTEKHKTLKKTDAFLCAVEGDSFSDIYGISRLRGIYKLLKIPRKMKKPLILLPQTIGPFESKEAGKIAKDILISTDAIFTRDPLSTKCAKELVPEKKVYESIDVALFMDYCKPQSEDGKIRVGINPSGLLWNGGYTRNNQFGLKVDYMSLIRGIIKYFRGFDGLQIELIAHVLPSMEYVIEDDYRICKKLSREFTGCKVAPFFYSPIEAKSYISGLDFLTSSRMHCCIAGLSSGVPTFPLAYSRKFRGLFEGGLEYSHFSELKYDDENTVLQKLDSAFSTRELIKNDIKRINNLICNRKTEFINNLAKVLRVILR